MNSNSLPAVPTIDVPDIGPDFSDHRLPIES